MSELSNMVSYLKIIYLFLHQKILHVIQFVQLIYIYIYIYCNGHLIPFISLITFCVRIYEPNEILKSLIHFRRQDIALKYQVQRSFSDFFMLN
jgi:hypothetical protein